MENSFFFIVKKFAALYKCFDTVQIDLRCCTEIYAFKSVKTLGAIAC